MSYVPQRPARSEQLPLRQLNVHVNCWGQPAPGSVPLVLVHGWMDVGASYQFMVDALSADFADRRLIIAPDWRCWCTAGWTWARPTSSWWTRSAPTLPIGA